MCKLTNTSFGTSCIEVINQPMFNYFTRLVSVHLIEFIIFVVMLLLMSYQFQISFKYHVLLKVFNSEIYWVSGENDNS